MHFSTKTGQYYQKTEVYLINLIFYILHKNVTLGNREN